MVRFSLPLTLLSLSVGTSLATQAPSDDFDDTPLPLVIWHGLGDSFDSEGMKWVGELAEQINPGTFVYNIALGQDGNSDRSASFFGNVTTQLEGVCEALAAHPILSTAPAIDAIGFSQGGQFLRGYVERCNLPPVRSLVTFGSQHSGIIKFKDCGSVDFLCKAAMALLNFNTWSSYVQSRLVPAQYFRDPNDRYDNYLESSNFLADINNERELKNVGYAKNLASLTKFVLYRFEDDTTVIPPGTAWFDDVEGIEVVPLKERALYKDDWLGLKKLDKKEALVFRTTPGDHMQLAGDVLNETITDFFGPWKRKFATAQVLEMGEL